MTRMKWVSGIVALMFASLVFAGCCDQEKKQISDLKAQNDKLAAAKLDLQNQLAQANAREADMLKDHEAELAKRDADMAELKRQLGAKPKVGTNVPPGWEEGIMGDRVTLGTDILFDSGKNTLTVAGKARLDKIVSDIRTHYGSKPIRVYGHTDTDPIKFTKDKWDDNLDLSAGQAMAVTRYLISKGLSAKQIETVAMGEWHPMATDKAKNRRVEIYVIKVTSTEKPPAAEK